MSIPQIRGKMVTINPMTGEIFVDRVSAKISIYYMFQNKFYNEYGEEIDEMRGLSLEQALVKKGLLK